MLNSHKQVPSGVRVRNTRLKTIDQAFGMETMKIAYGYRRVISTVRRKTGRAL